VFSIRRAWLALLACGVCLAQHVPGPSTRPSNPGFQALVKDATARIHEITVPQLQAMINADPKPLLIDVREDSEWQAGHAAGAIHIGRGVLERDIETAVPRKDAQIVVYCGGGARSALAADTLQKMGYTRVLSLAGGLNAYRLAGLPMQR